ncbi:MAG: Hsp70 family protein, partial [Verrucomicrobiota bacterium]
MTNDHDEASPDRSDESQLIIGIDLGTTHTLVGVVDSGFPIILADREGERLLPSVVTLSASGDSLVGRAASRQRVLQPERTFASVKRLIGRPFQDLEAQEIARLPFEIRADRVGEIEMVLADGSFINPIKISSEILAEARETAQHALEQPVTRAVITVPAYFNHRQRDATREAALLAGLTVERIINEPTAAALAYGLDRLEESAAIAVYDLGGGTFDLSILQMTDGFFEVIATAGDTALGGDDFDRLVAEEIIEQLDLEGPFSLEERAGLLEAARVAKESLSDSDRVDIRLPFFRDGKSFESELTRDRFEDLIAPLLQRTRVISEQAFAEARQKGIDRVDKIILVGGSTRVPAVARDLEKWFSLSPDLSQHPDEAVALGAAIQAGMLCGRIRSVTLVDVTPLSLGIETYGGLMNVLIPRNTTLPTKAGEMFTNAVDDQPSMAIRILQGERELARDNWHLGEIEVPFRPCKRGQARIGVQFAIDANGLLEVLTRDTETGEDHLLEIQSAAVDVTDAAVEQMVSESIDFAFDDMRERIWTEAELKSQELLPAVAT